MVLVLGYLDGGMHIHIHPGLVISTRNHAIPISDDYPPPMIRGQHLAVKPPCPSSRRFWSATHYPRLDCPLEGRQVLFFHGGAMTFRRTVLGGMRCASCF